MQIITEHFMPAGEKSGVPAPILAIHFQTGKWDAAQAVWADYVSKIAHAQTEVGHHHVPE
jgi:hypothetical protein